MASRQMKNQMNQMNQQKKKKSDPQVKNLRRSEQDIARQSVLQAVGLALGEGEHSAQAVKCLVSLVLPKESDPVRVGSIYGSDKTAVARLFRKTNLAQTTQTVPPSDLPISESAAFVFRDALRSFVYNFGLTSTQGCMYVNQGQFETAELETPVEYNQPFLLDTTVSNISPHGPTLYLGALGRSDPKRGFLCTNGNVISITVSATAGRANQYIPYYYRLDGAQWVVAAQGIGISQAAGGSGQHNVTETGYYAIGIYSQSSPGGAVTVDILVEINISGTYSAMTWAQLPLPRIDDNLDAVKAYRLPSVSLMYTNTSSPIYRAGQIAGLQLPKGSNWFDNIDYEEVASSSKAESYDIVNGMYGFLKPTSADDMAMKQFAFQNGNEFDYFFDLLPTSDYLTIHARVDDALGRVGMLYPAHHVEFTTQSQWFDSNSSEIASECYESAIQMMSMMPQWHKNENHLDNIWNWIKNTASSVWSGVKDVASTLAPLAPLALAVL